MFTLMRDMWHFMLGQPVHPVYRRELSGWSYVRVWRSLRHGCLPLIGLVLLVTTGCCSLFGVLALNDSAPSELPQAFLLTGFMIVIGLFWGTELVNGMIGLIATTLTATAISAEIEAQTYTILKLTPIPAREIMLAKFGAAMSQIRLPVMIVIFLRVVCFLAAVALLILSFAVVLNRTVPAGSPSSPAIPPDLGGTLLPLIFQKEILYLVLGIVAGLLWLAYFFMQPWLEAMLFTSMGLFASSLAKSRSGGIFGAWAMRVGLWILGYIASQVLAMAITLAMLPMVALPGVLDSLNQNPEVLVPIWLGFAIISGLLVPMIGLLLPVLFVHLAARRGERLPYDV
jgi:hypothetical protein